MKIYCAQRKNNILPKYDVEVKLTLDDLSQEELISNIYTQLKQYNDKLNKICKRIEIYWDYPQYYIKLVPKIQISNLIESTGRQSFDVAIRVLIAKLLIELPEYIEEFKDKIAFSENKNKLTPYKLIVKLVKEKFDIKLKTLCNYYDGAYIIDELPCSLDEYTKFLRSIYTKYKFDELSYYFPDPENMYKISKIYVDDEDSGKDFIYLNDGLKRAGAYFVYDEDKKDYVRLKI